MDAPKKRNTIRLRVKLALAKFIEDRREIITTRCPPLEALAQEASLHCGTRLTSANVSFIMREVGIEPSWAKAKPADDESLRTILRSAVAELDKLYGVVHQSGLRPPWIAQALAALGGGSDSTPPAQGSLLEP